MSGPQLSPAEALDFDLEGFDLFAGIDMGVQVLLIYENFVQIQYSVLFRSMELKDSRVLQKPSPSTYFFFDILGSCPQCHH